MKRGILLLSIILTIVLVTYDVQGHVPQTPDPGESLETAVEIEDPTKSWVIYNELHEAAEPQYYHFDMEQGQRIRLTLMIPINHGSMNFRPMLVLMGPGLINQSTHPEYLEVPEDAGIMLLEQDSIRAAYEGFTPTSFYVLSDIDLNAPETGHYYLAVFEPSMGGRYAITIGYRESFSLNEWLAVPFSVMIIHQWTGQDLIMILLPIVLTVIIGSIYFLYRKDELMENNNALTWIGILGGLLFISSGVFIFYQMGIALSQVTADFQVVVTIIFGLIPILLGISTMRILLSDGWASENSRLLKLLLIGLIAPFAWAGYLVGSTLVILVSVIPLLKNRMASKNDAHS